jgi:hypothetical protein
VFTSREYPERLGIQLLTLLKDKTEKTLSSRFHSSSSNSTHVDDIQMTLVEICRDFSDPNNSDKIYNCSRVLNTVTSDMKINVRKILDSNDSLAVI